MPGPLHVEMEVSMKAQRRKRLAAEKALLVDDWGKVYAEGRLVAIDINQSFPTEGFVGTRLSFEGQVSE